MDDIKHLLNMAKITLEQANNALNECHWSAYRTYVNEFNRLLELTVEQCGAEVHEYLKPIDVPPKHMVGASDMPEYLSTATLRLKELVAYFHALPLRVMHIV